MDYEHPLIEGTLIRRASRFRAEVKLKTGEQIDAHFAVGGAAESGSRVLVSAHHSARQKLQHQVEIIYAGRTPVGVHSGRPVTVVYEGLVRGQIQELAGYATVERRAKIKGDPLDLTLTGNGLRTCHLHVKSVTAAHNGTATFPDGPVLNGLEHLALLTDLVRGGCRAVIFFVAQRADVERFRLAEHNEPTYVQALQDAAARGVEIIAYRAKVTRKDIDLSKKLPVDLGT